MTTQALWLSRGEHLFVLEGNYADKVCLVDRTAECIIGAYRPVYAKSSEEGDELEEEEYIKPGDKPFLEIGDEGRAVAVLQYALHELGYNSDNSRLRNGDWDGEYGEGTQRALERCLGIDGAVCTEEIFIKLCKGEKL